MKFIDSIKSDYASMAISDKMKSLLSIATSVQQNSKSEMQLQTDKAKTCGATYKEIHDTVLIAAVFCMRNRYVAIEDRNYYIDRGKMRAEEGIVILT